MPETITNTYHGQEIVSTLGDDGWAYEVAGESFGSLGEAIQHAKKSITLPDALVAAGKTVKTGAYEHAEEEVPINTSPDEE